MSFHRRNIVIFLIPCVLFFLLFLIQKRQTSPIVRNHISLKIGSQHKLECKFPDKQVVWYSNNPNIQVDSTGMLSATAKAFGVGARAIITATSLVENVTETWYVTLVDWQTNLSKLEVIATLPADQILGADDQSIYFTLGDERMATFDDFQTSHILCTLPNSRVTPPLLFTPFGYFIRCGQTIYRSKDLLTWTPSFKLMKVGLPSTLTYYWDEKTLTGYVYAGEYSVRPMHRHSLYRGVFPSSGKESWEKILEFSSIKQWQEDRTLSDAARHLHIVVIDPYTGHLWVGTGDSNPHCKMMYSDDKGDSFRLVGMGDQSWRTLSIWFTEQYLYWSMDTPAPQSIWRIPRSKFTENGFWPELTPELSAGHTKIGLRYLVTKNETSEHFPVSIGRVYTETQARQLSTQNSVRVLDDKAYNYREEVVKLFNGSLWYHSWVKDDKGEKLVLLGGSPEGCLRDYRGRVFGIKECSDSSVDVQELFSMHSVKPDIYDEDTRYTKLLNFVQSPSGIIYFDGQNTPHKIYKTNLRWSSNCLDSSEVMSCKHQLSENLESIEQDLEAIEPLGTYQ